MIVYENPVQTADRAKRRWYARIFTGMSGHVEIPLVSFLDIAGLRNHSEQYRCARYERRALK
jgi:hypothetical protein